MDDEKILEKLKPWALIVTRELTASISPKLFKDCDLAWLFDSEDPTHEP